jgi:hypothetical protein
MKRFAFFLYLFLFPWAGYSQGSKVPLLERLVTVNVESMPYKSILSLMSEQAGVQFSYSSDVFNASQKITLNVQNKPVRYVLNRLFRGTVRFKEKGKYIILQKVPVDESSQKSQKAKVVEGYVFDSGSGKTLPEATVYNKNLMAAAVTDEFGYFRIELPPVEELPDLQVSKAGYSNIIIPAKNDSLVASDVEVTMQKTDDSTHQTIARFITDSILSTTLPKWMIPKKLSINSHNLGDTIFRKAQFSLVPKVSTNALLTGNVSNDVSINLLAGYVQSVNKFEAGALVNIVRFDVTGVQMAGLGNVVGRRVHGAQFAGLFNAVTEVEGLQMAGIINSTRRMSGMQMAGVVNTTGNSFGLQASGVINYSRDNADIQVAGNVNYAKIVNYMQLSGSVNVAHNVPLQVSGSVNVALDTGKYQIASAVNYSKGVSELQMAGILNIGRNAGTLQLSGLMNYAKNDVKCQISSLLNISGRVRNVQIGLINIADSCDGVTLGFFNFVKHGYHKIEIYADDAMYTNLAFRSGSKYLHSIFLGGYQVNHGNSGLWTYGWGIGTSLGNSRKWAFDIDMTTQKLLSEKYKDGDNQLLKLYVGIDKKLANNLSLAVGATGNFLFSNSSAAYQLSLEDVSTYSIKMYNQKEWKSWIGWKIGLRFL